MNRVTHVPCRRDSPRIPYGREMHAHEGDDPRSHTEQRPSPPLSWRGGRGYLDTANYGLPSSAVLEAVHDALDLWAEGRSRIVDWIDYCDRARHAFGTLIGVDCDTVTCAATTSQLVGTVATSMPDGAEVLVPNEEFTSNVFPWLVHSDRIVVRHAPFRALADAITEGTSVVAFSMVQSSNGAVADLDRILTAARSNHAEILIDVTQACGWLPLRCTDVDYVVCSAYKWLMAPRGCALMATRPDRLEQIRPIAAGWFAGDEIFESLYGPPLRLAPTARRLDVSPGWVGWAGTARALELINDIGIETIYAHDMQLAKRFAAALDIETESPIVSVGLPDHADLVTALRSIGVVASGRSGQLRMSFHLYNDESDVRRALDLVSHIYEESNYR